MNTVPLHSIHRGQRATVVRLQGDAVMVQRLRDLGLTEGSSVLCAFRAPGGDPTAYRIRGALIAIRKKDADGIRVEVHAS